MELTDEEVRLLRVHRFGPGAHLLGATVLPFQDDKQLQQALVALGGDPKSDANELRLLCNPRTMYGFVERVESNEPLDEAALMKIPQKLFNLDDPTAYLNFVLNPLTGKAYAHDPKQKEWAFVGAKKNALEEFQLRLGSAGFSLKALNWSLLSMAQGVRWAMSQTGSNVSLALWIGSESTWVAVVKQDRLLGIRNLSVGIKGLENQSLTRESISQNAPLRSSLERLQREVETFIGFYELQNALTVDSLYFAWPTESGLPLTAYFEQTMGLKILNINPLEWLQEKGIVVDNKESFMPLGSNGLALAAALMTDRF